MSQIYLYHIAYSPETLRAVAPGYEILNNLDSGRNDWREYWPIRKFLLETDLDGESYYGFFSPRFAEKTALSYAQVVEFVQSAGSGTDVVSFSPQADMGAFFLNVFDQQEMFDHGFTAASEAFFEAAGMSLDLASLVMDSRQVIFSNYFVARLAFWREWLTWNEKLFAICEGDDSALKRLFVNETNYSGAVQRKVFLMERIASVLLTVNSKWRVRAYDTYKFAWSSTRLNQFSFEAVLCDALKVAMKEQGFPEYRDAYVRLRDIAFQKN